MYIPINPTKESKEALSASFHDEQQERDHKLRSLSTPTQQQHSLSWNDTRSPYPQHDCVDQRFDEQATQRPDGIALVDEHGHFTYHEVNRQANQLAHYLRKHGVGREVLVAVYLERSSALIISLLGILKAGGAYVPFDPATPKERLAFMLEDAQPSILLTQHALLADLPSFPGAICCLDSDRVSIGQHSITTPHPLVDEAHRAYVIYTSGSTGRPKGVQVEHRSLANLISWHQATFRITSADRATQVAGPAFDAMVWEIWPYLTAGASIHIPDQATRADPRQLKHWLIAQAISICFLPTPLAEQILRLDWPDQLALRTMLTGGDRLSHIPASSLPFTLVNNYGPTENTVVATSGPVLADRGTNGLPPIGRPILNTQVYVLDSALQPVPVGATGELYIGGVQLARGYLNRPDLTAERFIPNPFGRLEIRDWRLGDSDTSISNLQSLISIGTRLYKTGDLGRYLPDGNIEFVGRIDHQVKLRGFRIELGEIEATLRQHPDVQAAIVQAHEDSSGNKRLVAYIVPTTDDRRPSAEDRRLKIEDSNVAASEKLSSILYPLSSIKDGSQWSVVGELRAFLKQRLPDYMVPPAFILLNALPLTPNGKIDRRALPTPTFIRSDPGAQFVAPRTDMETRLAAIWADVLGVQYVGIHDNFFNLGGDSILSFQIIARAYQAGLYITTKQLFQNPTIAELLATIGTEPAMQAEQAAVTGLVPLTPIQRWFFEQDFPDPHHWNQAMLLEVPESINPARLGQAVRHITTHHDALRLCFTRTAMGWEQVNAGPDVRSPFVWIDLSLLAPVDQRATLEALAAQVQASLDLARPPRFRAVLFSLGAGRPGRLLMVINYLAIDGVSWRIMLEDLQTAYQQSSLGQPIQLLPKTSAYQQWAERLAEHARSEALRHELPYWLDAIRPADSYIPLDNPGGANTMASARTLSLRLTTDETRALLQDVPKTYRTQINDLLLAALMRAFAQSAGVSALLIDLESHGREDLFDTLNLSRTVGWFTSLFPVFLRLEPGASPAETLIAIKEQLRRIPNRGTGYGLLRYLSGDPAIVRHLQDLPRPAIRFNYLGQFDQVVSGTSMFRRAHESYGPTRSPRGHRTHMLVIEGLIAEGCLQIEWTYSTHLHQRSTIKGLAQGYMAALRELIADCLDPEVGACTPSDFPLAKLDARKLSIVARLLSHSD